MEGNICALETKRCVVCGKEYETDALILTRDLTKTFKERHACTGLGLCPECRKVAEDNDAVYLVEAEKKGDSIRVYRAFLMKSSFFEQDSKAYEKIMEGRVAFIDPEQGEMFAKAYDRDNGEE